MRRDYAKAAGWAALALALITGVTYAVRNQADLWLWLPLGLALILGGLWLMEFKAQAAEVLRSRRTRQGANAVVFSLAVLVIAVLLQALAVSNDVSADLTKDKAYTLSDETVKTVKGLSTKVQVFAFYGNEGRAAFEDLLMRVKKLNPGSFDYDFVDPTSKPLLAQEYGIHALGTSVVVDGEQKESFNGSKEEDLLNALLKVSAGEKKQVYFLAGHQERDITDGQAGGASALKAGLEAANFVVRPLNLGSVAAADVPEDAAAVVVAGPRTDLLAPELDALTRFLGRGGRVLGAVDPRAKVPGFKAWLAKGGVALGEDIVIDVNPFNQIFGGSPLAPVIQDFDPNHPVTKDLVQAHGQAIFPQTRTVGLGKLPDGATGTVLAHSLGTAFGWTGTGNSAPTKPGPHDKKGPLDLMVAIDAPVKAFGGDAASDKKARLVVVGSSVLLCNNGVAAFNNQDLMVNSMRWLADEEKRIALAPKKAENSPLLLDRGRLQLVWWSFILMALGALGTGVLVTLRRRSAA
jgi:ABC-type uncharacterized transport system involved in gliding motility auxiliary subunit